MKYSWVCHLSQKCIIICRRLRLNLLEKHLLHTPCCLFGLCTSAWAMAAAVQVRCSKVSQGTYCVSVVIALYLGMDENYYKTNCTVRF